MNHYQNTSGDPQAAIAEQIPVAYPPAVPLPAATTDATLFVLALIVFIKCLKL